MTSEDQIRALADALEAAATSLRNSVAALATPAGPDRQVDPDGTAPAHLPTQIADPVERARKIHPALGARQAQIIEQLASAEPNGTDTGQISRALDYDQPNVYLTLAGLIRRGLAEKDTDKRPHRYRLSAVLR